MVWLDITEENGSGLYLDIRGIESRRVRGDAVFAISGIVGDGRAEVEVLVEVGRGVEVVFVDEWLGKERPGGLFAGVNREELLSALVDSIADISFCIESVTAQKVRSYRSGGHWRPLRPESYAGQMDLPLVV